MTTKEKIIEILNENPNLSAREIGKQLGKARSTINAAIKKLGIPRDRAELQKINNTQRSFDMEISHELNQLILGSLLGDGSMSKNSRYENSKLNLNSRLMITHSLVQKDYALYKANLLKKFGLDNRTENYFKKKNPT